MKKTPLNEFHRKLGAKMTDFAGWDMPMLYSGIIEEHKSTRNRSGLFDISHMGEIMVKGKEVVKFLEKITCNSITSIKENQVQYNVILNERGGIVDDVTIYNLSQNKFLICCNASNVDKVFNHLTKINQNSTVQIINESEQWNQIAIQGPKSEFILEKYLGKNLQHVLYYNFSIFDINNQPVIISRTGYTGEDGFEIYSNRSIGIQFWNELLELGKDDGLVPVGLAARDLLRIEARYPLYGNELNEDMTPSESSLSWLIREKEMKFFAYEKLIEEKREKTHQRQIIHFEMLENGIPRENFSIFDLEKNQIGKVTSGIYSPVLKKGIGFALVPREKIMNDFEFLIKIRDNMVKAKIRKKPFIQTNIKKENK